MESSWTREWTYVSCIGRQIRIHWATEESQHLAHLNSSQVVGLWGRLGWYINSWDCHNKGPQLEWPKQQQCIFSQSCRLGIQDHSVSSVGTFWSLAPRFAETTLCPHVVLPLCVPVSKSFLFLKLFFNWGIVALQCCVSFRCATKWISYTYTYLHSLLDFFPI